MRTKKSIRRAFRAAMPDVLHRVMEDCPAVKADEPSPAPVSAPMMPRSHWFKELVATAAALALLIGVAAGGLMFLRNTGGLQASQNPSAPADSEPSLDDPIGEVPLAVPASVRAEILSMLGIEGAALEIVPSLRGEYYAYAVGHEGFAYSFVFDSFDEFVGVDIVETTMESILPPLIAKQLLQQHLLASVDAESAEQLRSPEIVTEGELLTLDVGIFYHFFVSLNPVMSYLPSYYVEATTGDVYEKLPESDLTPPEEPWNILESRDRALLAVHLSLDEVYFLYGDFPANEDGEYYIRWWIKTENAIYAVNQSKDYQALDIASGDPSDVFHEVPDEWYPWQKARHISLEDAGVRLEDVTALDCSYMADQAWYIVTFTVEDVKYTYGVSAEDGSIVYSNFDLPAENYVSKEYALDLVARQTELPEALRNAVLSGEAGGVCTLSKDVYSVELLWKDDAYSYSCYAQVNAVTGELLSFRVDTQPHQTGTQPGSPDASNVAEYTIVDLFGYTMEEAYVLSVDAYPEHFVVTFFAAGCRYEAHVDAAGGALISHTAEDQYDALEKFNKIFGDQTSYYNWALVDPYTDITGLRLQTLFANAKSDDWQMPDVEWYDEWLNSLPETQRYYDYNFVPRELMNQVLEIYFGVQLTDLPTECFAGMRYIDTIGWYSCVASDYPVVEGFQAGGIEELENGDIALYYSRSDSNVMWVVTLRLSRNSNAPWQIVSNTPLPPA